MVFLNEQKEEIIKLHKSGKKVREIVKIMVPAEKATIKAHKEIYAIIEEYHKERAEEERSKKIHQKIYELREKGLTCEQTKETLNKEGIKISLEELNEIYKEIFERKSKRLELESINAKIDVYNEVIFELREKRMSYVRICEILRKKEVKISSTTVALRCKEIYKLKGKKEPKAIARKKNKKHHIDEEKVYKMREQHFTYRKIADILKEEGTKISPTSIRLLCKEIYRKKEKEEPKVSYYNEVIYDEQIYELREQKNSYMSISKILKEKGINISLETIKRRCEEIYTIKGKKQPMLNERIEEYNEQIYELRGKGYSFYKIEKIMKEQGIKISRTTINRRYKEREIRSFNKNKYGEEQIINMILNLKNTRNATDEQIKQIADEYGVNIEKVKDKNSIEER